MIWPIAAQSGLPSKCDERCDMVYSECYGPSPLHRHSAAVNRVLDSQNEPRVEQAGAHGEMSKPFQTV